MSDGSAAVSTLELLCLRAGALQMHSDPLICISTRVLPRFVAFIIVEHFILLFKIIIDLIIPDVPKSISRAMVWKEVLKDDVLKQQKSDAVASGLAKVRLSSFCFVSGTDMAVLAG